MTRYVIRAGKVVEKPPAKPNPPGPLAMPRLSRMTAFESPVTGKEITSWRERDRDMQAAGAVDPRDLPRKPFEERAKDNARTRNTPAEWS